MNFRSKCFASHWNFTLHEQILLKLHFLLTLLIPSRKLCVILITDTNYIISSFLFIEASVKIHQVKDMVIIIIFKIHLNSLTTYTQKMLIALKVHVSACMWECTCQNSVYICHYKGWEHFLCWNFGLLPWVLSFDKVIWFARSYGNQYSGINLKFLWFFKWYYYWWKDTVILSSYSLILQNFAHMVSSAVTTLPSLTILDKKSLIVFQWRKKGIRETIKQCFKPQQRSNTGNNALLCKNMSL